MSKTKKMIIVALTAGVYTALSLAVPALSFANIQCRFAEALNLLPIVFPISAYGVILGCFLTNLLGAMMGLNILGYLDCIVGTAATVISLYFVVKFKNVKFKDVPWLSMLMPVIFNGVIIGIELGYVIFSDNIIIGSLISGIEVAIGEAIAMIIGYFVNKAFIKTRILEKL